MKRFAKRYGWQDGGKKVQIGIQFGEWDDSHSYEWYLEYRLLDGLICLVQLPDEFAVTNHGGTLYAIQSHYDPRFGADSWETVVTALEAEGFEDVTGTAHAPQEGG
jgi:hypothetical protein